MKAFKDKVREGRTKAGLTQKQLAELIGVSHRTITSYEQGERKPYPAQQGKLANILGVPIEYLTDNEAADNSARRITSDPEDMLRLNQAFFANDQFSADIKDEYFQALTVAYHKYRRATLDQQRQKRNELPQYLLD